MAIRDELYAKFGITAEAAQLFETELGTLILSLCGLESRFSSALRARNRLIHGFYERHNFKIQTDAGRDEMIADLEAIHEELFQAWQVAGVLTEICTYLKPPLLLPHLGNPQQL